MGLGGWVGFVADLIRRIGDQSRAGDEAGAFVFGHGFGGVALDAGAGFFPLVAGNVLDGEHAVLFGALEFFGGEFGRGGGIFGWLGGRLRGGRVLGLAGARGTRGALFLEGEALFGDAVSVFGGGGAAVGDFHLVLEGLLLEGEGKDAADLEEFGGFEVGAFGGDDGVGHFLEVALGEEGVGLGFAALEVEVFGEGDGLGGGLGEEAVLAVAIKEFLEGFAGDAEVEAALGPRFGEAGDGVIVGFVFVVKGLGEGLAFDGVERGEGDEGAEFALEVHGFGGWIVCSWSVVSG
jgi:hypothetical protein